MGATHQGRLMVIGGAVGALVAGAATALVNFGFGVGTTVHRCLPIPSCTSLIRFTLMLPERFCRPSLVR